MTIHACLRSLDVDFQNEKHGGHERYEVSKLRDFYCGSMDFDIYTRVGNNRAYCWQDG